MRNRIGITAKFLCLVPEPPKALPEFRLLCFFPPLKDYFIELCIKIEFFSSKLIQVIKIRLFGIICTNLEQAAAM